MECQYYDMAVCRSCRLMGTPHEDQLAGKEQHCRDLLRAHPDARWLPAVAGPEAGYRSKAKMVVAGTVEAPTLGILDGDGHGVDLRACGICSPGLRALLPDLAAFVRTARLTPYDVPARTGELKHLLITESPDGEAMVRFVLRSQEPLARIRTHLPDLIAARPHIAVVSVNLQPAHAAILEGEREIILTDSEYLSMRLHGRSASRSKGAVELDLPPQSFFQTNTAVAERLYLQVEQWADEIGPATVWDLYCGVGGFALHLASPGRGVVGIESSARAVAGAERAARRSRAGNVRFEVADAAAYAAAARTHPDLVVLNPPRRGIGEDLASWLEASTVRHVVYCSCNAVSLAHDLAAMPSLRLRQACVLDMFPQTSHYEVAVLLEREPGAERTRDASAPRPHGPS